MDQSPPGWVAPDVPADPPGTTTGERYRSSAQLGGSAAVVAEPEHRSPTRDLVVGAVLLIAAVLTVLASLMSWRDYGRGLDPDENGWRLADGALGRGWVAVLVAVALAVGGVLLVMGRRRSGRRWARVGSTALIVLPIVEWAFGDGDSRTGPGMGLWVLMVTGMVLMALLGTVLPQDDLDPPGR